MTRPVFPLAALIALAPALAMAATRDDVLSAASRCAAVQDDRAWLDCYYGAAQPMRRQLGLTPAPQAQQILVPPAPSAPFPQAAAVAQATPPQQTAMVAAPPPKKGRDGVFFDIVGGKILVSKMAAKSYAFDGSGHFVLTLADGEVWRQSPGDEQLARWTKPASDYLVTVRDGAIGSVQLEVQGDSQIYKVKRVR